MAELIGTYTPDNLIAGIWPPTETMAVTLGEAATLERGQILGFDESAGTFALMADGLTASAIVATTMTAEGTVAEAYRSGCFYRGEVETRTGYELTAADEENLRKSNIYLRSGLDELVTATEDENTESTDTEDETAE